MNILHIRQSRDTVNTVYARGLEQNGAKILDLYLKSSIPSFFKLIKFYRKEGDNIDLILVGFSSPLLAIWARLISGKKIIYNSAVSVYDRLISSRKLAGKFSIKTSFYLLLDFLAAHLSNLTMVESNSQAQFFKKNFKLNDKKIFRAWIGVAEDRFFYDSTVSKFDTFTVLFRGNFLPEAGTEYVVRAAKILEGKNVKFLIVGDGQEADKITGLIEELRPSNLEWIKDFMPQEELREIMQKCHVVLGQLSDHPRLARTVPYKVFESLAMKLPYLTASNKGILELVQAGETCITCNPADADSLAEKILWIKNNYSAAEKIAENGYNLYKDSLTPRILAKKLLDRIGDI